MSAALIIIDLIEEIVERITRADSHKTVALKHELITRSNKAAAYARIRKIPVIWVRVGFADDYHDIPRHSPMFSKLKQVGGLRLSSRGCHWVDGLDIQPTDLQVVKKAISAFAGNDLLSWLKEHHCHHLLLGGVSSTMAIESTVRQAHDLGYQITVLQDLCAAASLESHQHSMDILQNLSRVMTSEEWMKN